MKMEDAGLPSEHAAHSTVGGQPGLQFFQQAVTSRDRAALIPFNDRPTLAVRMTNRQEDLGAGLAGLKAERGTVWLYDAKADELVLEVATGIAPVRVPAGTGIAGSCARNRQIINVPDCYADPRFNPDVDKRSGYRTRCMLILPLIEHRSDLVGVMQVLNKVGGVFDPDDEALATDLAAQCAVALQRVRMTEALIEAEKLRQEMEMARVVQMSTLPATMPSVQQAEPEAGGAHTDDHQSAGAPRNRSAKVRLRPHRGPPISTPDRASQATDAADPGDGAAGGVGEALDRRRLAEVGGRVYQQAVTRDQDGS